MACSNARPQSRQAPSQNCQRSGQMMRGRRINVGGQTAMSWFRVGFRFVKRRIPDALPKERLVAHLARVHMHASVSWPVCGLSSCFEEQLRHLDTNFGLQRSMRRSIVEAGLKFDINLQGCRTALFPLQTLSKSISQRYAND